MQIDDIISALQQAKKNRLEDRLHKGTDVYKIIVHNTAGNGDFIEVAYSDEKGILHGAFPSAKIKCSLCPEEFETTFLYGKHIHDNHPELLHGGKTQ